MIITLDINVLLDVFQQRQPHYAMSARVVDLVILGSLTGVFPAHGLTTLYYLVRKHASKTAAEAAMDHVLRHFRVGNLDLAGWQAARVMPLADFEDAVVAEVAVATGSSFLVTRNVGDFAGASIPALTPTDFLSRFALP